MSRGHCQRWTQDLEVVLKRRGGPGSGRLIVARDPLEIRDDRDKLDFSASLHL
jgi:hypothetical protein